MKNPTINHQIYRSLIKQRRLIIPAEKYRKFLYFYFQINVGSYMIDHIPAICPKLHLCRLFQNKILPGPEKENVYKIIFCNTTRYKDCIRFQIYRKTGTCPDFIMPNSKHDRDYILKKIEEEEPSAVAEELGR